MPAGYVVAMRINQTEKRLPTPNLLGLPIIGEKDTELFIKAYLRASTEDQFADRAKERLEQFVQKRGFKIANYYRENISGTKLDRPELGRLLMDSHHNDILLAAQIDRLTRLSNSAAG